MPTYYRKGYVRDLRDAMFEYRGALKTAVTQLERVTRETHNLCAESQDTLDELYRTLYGEKEE